MDWDTVYGDLKNLANRAADKLGQTASLASMQVKLSVAQRRLEEAYAALGKIAYAHFTAEKDLSAQVADAVSDVNKARAAVLVIEREIAKMQKSKPEKEGKSEDV